jgi:hypothetical protein
MKFFGCVAVLPGELCRDSVVYRLFRLDHVETVDRVSDVEDLDVRLIGGGRFVVRGEDARRLWSELVLSLHPTCLSLRSHEIKAALLAGSLREGDLMKQWELAASHTA